MNDGRRQSKRNGAPLSPGHVAVSARRLPLVRRVDVAIAGGTLAAVAAAVQAARGGATVFLAAPRLFLGEDLCGTLRLWRCASDGRSGPLTDALFAGGDWTTPLRVKRTLDDALREAGVEVVLGAVPVGVLETADGRLAGLVVATRAGRQAVAAGALVDATALGLVAQAAGATHTAPVPRRLTAGRVVLGGEDSRAVPACTRPCAVPGRDAPLGCHEYELEFDLPACTPSVLSDLEQQARDATYRPGQLRAAETLMLHGLPGLTPVDGLFRLGWDCGEEDGTAAGTAAAAAARARPTVRPAAVRGQARAAGATLPGDLVEGLRGFRPGDVADDTVPAGPDALPVLARVAVLVVGGGTAGAAAGIAAARAGAEVLVVEYQEALGGVGTVGLIGAPYHGRNVGFAAEVPFPDREHNLEHKMEWLRREVRTAGGQVWLGCLAFGAYRQGSRLLGAALATPWGHGVVLADVLIDATGNADVAADAGAETQFGAAPDDIALQGTGLATRPLGRDNVNTDYLLVDESDVLDVTCALRGSLQALAPDACYDMLPFIQSRERRRIVGDHVLRYLDQLVGRTYPDTVVVSSSDYDAHGYPTLPFFALLPHDEQTRRQNHPAPGGEAHTPYRCLLPKGLDGILVAGLGISMERDASALVRMQRDLLNQGCAVGYAAALAAAAGVSPRAVEVRALQQRLVSDGALPAAVLEETDSFPLPPAAVARAVAEFGNPDLGYDRRARALAAIFAHAATARPLVRSAFRQAAPPAERLRYAALLGFLGEPDGLELLCAALAQSAWDEKILQGGMAEYAHLPTPVDALVLALGYSGSRAALPPILDKLNLLDAQTTLSHHRAVALALEHLADPRAAAPLATLLARPGMGGHAMTAPEPLFDKPVARRRREGPLREIVLARALWRCGDANGLGKRTLAAYGRDVRGLFAQHARAILAGASPPAAGRP
jgi:hypothetical protein